MQNLTMYHARSENITYSKTRTEYNVTDIGNDSREDCTGNQKGLDCVAEISNFRIPVKMDTRMQ